MRRLLPSPVLSLALFALWLLLARSTAPGTLLLGALLALAVPALTAPVRPRAVRLRRPLVALRLLAVLVADSLRSNLEVGRAILGRRQFRSDFVRVPLDLRDPSALAVLAMMITANPGTAWAELAVDRSVLLLHVLAVEDEAAIVAHIKARYERPLMEIFE